MLVHMRASPQRSKPAKQTVSLTIDSALYAEAKKLGINASQIAQEALEREVTRRRAEQIRREIEQDLEATSRYVEKHGSFADMVREHYRANDDE
jgi:post-segregation antitoxin (ccd killing protein)